MRTVDWFQLWPAVKADVEARFEAREEELRSEINQAGLRAGLGHFREAGRGIVEQVVRLNEFINEHDPTNPARERVREAPGALAELLRVVGARIGEGAAAAQETLGQGATDLEFLLRQFVLDEIVGDGDADFPEGNPRAVRAERFAEGPRDRLGARLFGRR